jgi:hypothetical protein
VTAEEFFNACLDQNGSLMRLPPYTSDHQAPCTFNIQFLPQHFWFCGFKGEVVLKGKRIYCILRMPEPLVAYVKPIYIKATKGFF